MPKDLPTASPHHSWTEEKLLQTVERGERTRRDDKKPSLRAWHLGAGFVLVFVFRVRSEHEPRPRISRKGAKAAKEKKNEKPLRAWRLGAKIELCLNSEKILSLAAG